MSPTVGIIWGLFLGSLTGSPLLSFSASSSLWLRSGDWTGYENVWDGSEDSSSSTWSFNSSNTSSPFSSVSSWTGEDNIPVLIVANPVRSTLAILNPPSSALTSSGDSILSSVNSSISDLWARGLRILSIASANTILA